MKRIKRFLYKLLPLCREIVVMDSRVDMKLLDEWLANNKRDGIRWKSDFYLPKNGEPDYDWCYTFTGYGAREFALRFKLSNNFESRGGIRRSRPMMK